MSTLDVLQKVRNHFGIIVIESVFWFDCSFDDLRCSSNFMRSYYPKSLEKAASITSSSLNFGFDLISKKKVPLETTYDRYYTTVLRS